MLDAASFAMVLVPEDIGVRANFGRAGAAHLAQAALRRLLAMQDNNMIRGRDMVVLGEVHVNDLMQQAIGLDANRPADWQKLSDLVIEVDTRVQSVVQAVVKTGHRVIVLGGGHENGWGILAGLHQGIGAPPSCVNLDAHADLRNDPHRHSGNAFSKAMEAGHLVRYAAIGLHEAYLNAHMAARIQKEDALHAITWDAIVRGAYSLEQACDTTISFSGRGPVALEVDLDVVAGMAASASSPTGMTAEQLRMCVHRLTKGLDTRSLHICEGIPGEGDSSGAGKLAAVLVVDFIQAVQGKRA